MTQGTTGLRLRSRDGATWRFDPGALCLELLTAGAPGAFSRYESLHQPADLATWLGRSRLRLDPAAVRADAAALAGAKALRDALWRLSWARIGDLTPDPADLATLNRAAAAPPLVPRLDDAGARAWALPADATQALSTIARDAVELLGGPLAGRVRECAAHNCSLVFVDTSRPGHRRWCSMERCGTRDKVRAFRERAGAEGTRPSVVGSDGGR